MNSTKRFNSIILIPLPSNTEEKPLVEERGGGEGGRRWESTVQRHTDKKNTLVSGTTPEIPNFHDHRYDEEPWNKLRGRARGGTHQLKKTNYLGCSSPLQRHSGAVLEPTGTFYISTCLNDVLSLFPYLHIMLIQIPFECARMLRVAFLAFPHKKIQNVDCSAFLKVLSTPSLLTWWINSRRRWECHLASVAECIKCVDL